MRGEVQGEPHIFVLPAEHDFQFGFAWSGARTTMLAPRALPWRRRNTLPVSDRLGLAVDNA
ncbi:hypothetical protein PSAB6_70256 [Paraburkholderia sabiae]|uniref:hypothetical protein n=1 Tax=Paraburkholderia sabiae TaxID=273251 RepID=UPI001CB5AF53|nr:hypothetical protein [Paraburkholderia sabiae]CAG9237340.1 hypothetical protein PSAB6_70256 [Paraburkholderia sabiae]